MFGWRIALEILIVNGDRVIAFLTKDDTSRHRAVKVN